MEHYRIYGQFRPIHYDLHVNLARAERRFTGTVTIEGDTPKPSDSILLHARELSISQATIDGQPATVTPGDHDTIKLEAANLQAGTHTVIVDFDGSITDPMHGLYPCYFTLDGQPEELLATQFESHHAREVFPCVDEPEAKATFDLTLTTEPDVTVLSNTPVREQHQLDGELVTSFLTTPVMSTYLLAWVVGKLDYQEAKTSGGVAVRAYATPANRDKLSFALEAAVQSLDFFNEYFDLPYPLPKCDFVALPDFSSAAMENWGCITFRESMLLVDETSSTHTKQYVVMVIAHELAHQWFGDLVTMRWWNDLWLNESFANWIEYLATDQLHPEWHMWTQYFDAETTYAFDRDSLPSVQKIQQEVHEPAEIQTLFDPAIVYAKGGSLLNMLHAYIGAQDFRDGLRIYLKRHAYANTTASDLWQALGEASHKDIGHFMEPWVSQPGLPLVTAGVSDHTLNLHQRRFLSDPRLANQPDQTTWPIPLLAADALQADLLDQPSASLPLHQTGKPLLLNQGRTGYYLSMYDTQHLQQLATEVRDGELSVIDRLGLLSDSVYLSQAGLQSQVDAMRLLESFKHETAEPVWGAIGSHISTLKMFADNDEQQLADLRRFVHDLALAQYQRLGWEPRPDEPYFDELLRPQILAYMAYAEDQEVTSRLRQMFADASKPGDIWADVRATVCSVALKYGGQAEFDKLLGWYQHASAEEHVQLAASMGGLKDPQLIKSAIDLLKTDAIKRQDLIYWFIYLLRNRYARQQAWQWLQQNWDWIVQHFGNDMHYADFPKHTAGAFSTREQLDSYQQFFDPKRRDAGLERSIQQGVEDIESKALWRERDGKAVADYLGRYPAA